MSKYERACQIWAALVYAASKSHILTYEELSAATGLASFGMTDELGLLQSYCKDNGLPPITAIVVSKKSGEPASGFSAVNPEKWPATLQEIFQHPWAREQAPTPESLGAPDDLPGSDNATRQQAASGTSRQNGEVDAHGVNVYNKSDSRQTTKEDEMVIVLIHWKIKPDRVKEFLAFWKKGLIIEDRSGLICEYLCEAAKIKTPLWVTWDLGPKAEEGEFKSYVNVGLWEDENAFHEQVGKNFNECKPLEEFEAYRRVRTVLYREHHRKGEANPPVESSDGVL